MAACEEKAEERTGSTVEAFDEAGGHFGRALRVD
jgi:hypothetical protein